MIITPINLKPNFGNSIASPLKNKDEKPAKTKLSAMIDPEIFFIDLFSYGKNRLWAQKMSDLTLETAFLMKENENFDDILKYIEASIAQINNNYWYGHRSENLGSFIMCEEGRGQEYYIPYRERIYQIKEFKAKPNVEYRNANTAKIKNCRLGNNYISVEYGRSVNNYTSNLDLVKKAYLKLRNLENPSARDILKKTATIRWLINQESPYARGNESVATILERSIFALYGIENSRYKRGLSPDFEAFYRDLDDYIEAYPSLFEKTPDFIFQS